jgi:pyrroloquinoline-quinone synthase
VNTAATALERIETSIRERNMLLHPFYQAWTRGELTLAALRDYARQYYHHVAAFPTYLSALHSHTDDQRVRRQILANLMDEEAGNPNHPELWLRFAESTGLSREEVTHAELWNETKDLIRTFRSACREGSVASGLAALYAYESQIPKVAESKIKGLEKFYGLNSPDALDYFRVHSEADLEHSQVERKLLESTLNEEEANNAETAANNVLDSIWGLLSAACHRHGIQC